MRPLSLLVALGGVGLTLAGVFSIDEALQRNQLRQQAEQLIPERQPLCLEPELTWSFQDGGSASPAAGPKREGPQLRVMPCTTLRLSPLRLPLEPSWALVAGSEAASVVSVDQAAWPGQPMQSQQLATRLKGMPPGDLSHRWGANNGWLEQLWLLHLPGQRQQLASQIGRAHV